MNDISVARLDVERLAALNTYQAALIAERTAFEEIARLAALLCGTPICLVSLVDHDRLDVLAATGCNGTLQRAGAEAFCVHTLAGHEVFEVTDTRVDSRFARH